jgi:hypothetical protein
MFNNLIIKFVLFLIHPKKVRVDIFNNAFTSLVCHPTICSHVSRLEIKFNNKPFTQIECRWNKFLQPFA